MEYFIFVKELLWFLSCELCNDFVEYYSFCHCHHAFVTFSGIGTLGIDNVLICFEEVVKFGLWLAPGDSEEVAAALSQALRNCIERLLFIHLWNPSKIHYDPELTSCDSQSALWILLYEIWRCIFKVPPISKWGQFQVCCDHLCFKLRVFVWVYVFWFLLIVQFYFWFKRIPCPLYVNPFLIFKEVSLFLIFKKKKKKPNADCFVFVLVGEASLQLNSSLLPPRREFSCML